MIKLLLALCTFAAVSSSYADVVWDVSIQNTIFCYPKGQDGAGIPGSRPVDKSFCLEKYGVEWAVARDRSSVLCYAVYPEALNVTTRYPVDANYCYRKYGAEWSRNDAGGISCFPLFPGINMSRRWAIDDSYCAY